MNVLHVGNIAFVGSNLCYELKNRNIQCELISKNKGIHHLSQNGFIKYAKNFIQELGLCGLNPNSFDIIHDHYLINWGSLGLSLKKTNKPILLHCHGSDTRPKNRIEQIIQRRVARKSKFMFYSTPDLLENIEWFEGRKIYLPNPVSIEPIEVKVRHEKRILIFGTMHRIKKIESVFEMIQGMPFDFDMILIGPHCQYYKNLAPKNVNFIKALRHEDVAPTLSQYQLVIGASQDGSIRMCELEAMARGIPTLFPFKYNDFYPEGLPMPENWQENIGEYFGDTNLGERQRQWVELYHSSEKIVDQLVKIYDRVLST